MKRCNVCKERLPLSAFGNNKSLRDGLMPRCRACNVAVVKKYYKSPTPAENFAKRLSRHHITLNQYEQMLKIQGFSCAVCHRRSPGHIDHDHACCKGMYSCGRCIRGLLCSQCNTALGLLYEDPDVMNNALRYVQRPVSSTGERLAYNEKVGGSTPSLGTAA